MRTPSTSSAPDQELHRQGDRTSQDTPRAFMCSHMRVITRGPDTEMRGDDAREENMGAGSPDRPSVPPRRHPSMRTVSIDPNGARGERLPSSWGTSMLLLALLISWVAAGVSAFDGLVKGAGVAEHAAHG